MAETAPRRAGGPHPAAWWSWGLGLVALGLFTVALVARLGCVRYACVGSSAEQVLNLDAIGGLPRLFTTGLFVAVCVLAGREGRRSEGRTATWWWLVVLAAGALALLKAVSGHSIAKATSPALTLSVSTLLAAVAVAVLWTTGHRWRVAAGRPVAVAVGLYAVAALGLELVTAAGAALASAHGGVEVAVGTYVEELGEALTATVLLTTVHRWTTRRRRAAGATTPRR
ncbi:hypothetical protein [Geodermatophilus sp. SYSU D00684]